MKTVIVCIGLLCALHLLAFLVTYEGLRTHRFSQSDQKSTVIQPITFAHGQPQEDRAKKLAITMTRLAQQSTIFFQWPDLKPLLETKKEEYWKSRGLGYYLWKPWICLQVWNSLPMGSILWQCDGNIKWIAPIEEYIARASNGGLVFGLPQTQKQFTKRKVFFALNESQVAKKNLCQLSASTFFVCKNQKNMSFFQEWFSYCNQDNLLNDDLEDGDRSNGVRHRHDQSIFSLLAYKYHFDIVWPQTRTQLDFPYRKRDKPVHQDLGIWR